VNYNAWNGKTFKLDHFDYYVSNVQLTYDGGQTVLIDSVFLVEPQSHTLLLGNFNLSQIEKINFMVGVPKPRNLQSGSQAIDISLYPENHPLSFQSPTMYWGWQFGYMHMIIGGYADDNGDGSIEYVDTEIIYETGAYFIINFTDGDSFLIAKNKVDNLEFIKNKIQELQVKFGIPFEQKLDWVWK
jgi:hypothetical protein